MNDYIGGSHGRFDAMYYWEQFHPILSAVAILLIGWIIALLIAAGVKKVLQKLGTNQKLSNATGHRSNIENILSRVIFWIILIIAAVFIIGMGAWAMRRIKEQSIKVERRFYNFDLSKGEEK